MFLNQYCTEFKNNKFSFSRQQSSAFAKTVANDFNPIHDIDAKKFCVPGDLLFAKILTKHGLFTDMEVHFKGMVSDEKELEILSSDSGLATISDDNGKDYLSIKHSGECTQDQPLIEQLIRSYVAFSGENFPHVLVPLMKKNDVMINPSRPLVMYESMAVHLDRLDLKHPTLEAKESELEVSGKRGNVTLHFEFKDNGQPVGKGIKTMLLSGLREYDQISVDNMVMDYDRRKLQHVA